LEIAVSQPDCNGTIPTPPGTWYTKQASDGHWYFYNDALGNGPIPLRGISMTGFETGTRNTGSGAGYWLFMADQPSNAISETIIRNIVTTLVKDWGINIIRIPICGSGWLQNYQILGYGGINPAIPYRTWVDVAICQAMQLGAVVLLDNHLWAIAPESSTTKNQGMEDGCTGINKVEGIDSCAPHDWYGQYTSQRTGKTYNTGDDPKNWECAIANADGCTLDNILRNNNQEHFLNLWYELANRYKNNPYVWFELFNEPYQRKSAAFGQPNGFGDNLPESEYNWAAWSNLTYQTVSVIRDQVKANNIILTAGLDWNYDYLGDSSSSNPGPIVNPNLLTWKNYKNIAYSFHPYQHGACCGQVGSSSDLSATDPYQSAFCLYPPTDGNGTPVPSYSSIPVPNHSCDTTGYAETQNKKAPPCVWAPFAKKPGSSQVGLCAGDRDECDGLTQSACNQKNANWNVSTSGGWSKYVYPMAKYGPLIATEFGPFDCSSPFTTQFLRFTTNYQIPYTAWALWPQNSGGPGAGACGYPSVMFPSAGDSDGFGKGNPNCQTSSGCTSMLKPLAWSAQLVAQDIQKI